MEDLNPSEISKIIKDRINKLDVSAEESNEGTIVFLADGIARVLDRMLVLIEGLVDGTITNPG